MTSARIAAISAVAAAALFTAAVLVWHFLLHDPIWPEPRPLPELHGFVGFTIYRWMSWMLTAACVSMVALALIGTMMRRHGVPRFLLVSLATVSSAAVAMLYLPFYGLFMRRFDRVRGPMEEPIRSIQGFVVTLIATLLVAVVFIVSTQLRHTREATRHVANVTAALLGLIFVQFTWFFAFVPITSEWNPLNGYAGEKLVAFRPCRGATVWIPPPHAHPFGRIDDLWLRFADPRAGGAPAHAVSVEMTWIEGYAWLTIPEATRLRVRSDDPSVTRCDNRWRSEGVVSARWHKLGLQGW